MDQFIASVAKMRQAVIKSGGRPDTLRISKQHIETWRLFGMKIIIVDESLLPKDVAYMVTDDTRLRNE